MGDDTPVFKRDDVAADGEVVVGHFVADGGGFQGSAAFIDFIEVVAEDGGVGNF